MSLKMDGQKYWIYHFIEGISILSILAVLLVQLVNVNPFAAGWDQVDYSLALERYDLSRMQPHFPGYPYFILGGKLISLLTGNTPAALTLFNIILYGSSVIPVFLLAARHLPRHYAWLLAAIVYTSAYPLAMVNTPMSEGAALGVFWWYFLSLVFASEKEKPAYILLPMFLFSILLGVRLSYLPLGIGLLVLLMIKLKWKQVSIKSASMIVFIGILFQLVWVAAVAVTEGGLAPFLKLAFGFTGGHFQDWGGTAALDEASFFGRIKQYTAGNIIWWGVAGRSLALFCCYAVALLLLLIPGKKEWKKGVSSDIVWIGVFMAGAYFLWALEAQNIEKPRHIIPVALLVIFLVIGFMLKKAKTLPALIVASCLLIIQSGLASADIREQAREIPAIYQAAYFLEKQETPLVVYTWEETRVMEYLEMPYSHKRVYTYDVFLHDSSYYQNHSIYLTDSVVEGFVSQGADLEGKIEKAAQFRSNSLFDPVYNEIVLYRWKDSGKEQQNERNHQE
ncbi:hypothetical protein [Mesobacillus zeae]|uniref:Glycosyltransferase RgtA/B/C/D-like domain-containing protein n=1 Tax=Mesobacillus zeae TaxID=1917180 RepID=A0A398B697_9BACI|nr:hypothetical protein [Mesobacillus zeae]RID83213.1 hypothetical protein D1970_17000 [Mesobacillus zeae]